MNKRKQTGNTERFFTILQVCMSGLRSCGAVLLLFYPPRWALHRGQVATVQENPGNQEKRLSAGQCCLMSAFLKVITSNWCPWGFWKSWTLTLRPPTTVSLRLESASRLGTCWMSVPWASSCPHALHNIRASLLVPSSFATAAHASLCRLNLE